MSGTSSLPCRRRTLGILPVSGMPGYRVASSFCWGPGSFCEVLLVFYLYFCGFRLDPYTKLARVTGMARTEAVCEVFFAVFCYGFGPIYKLVFGPRSVNLSVRPRQYTRLPSVPRLHGFSFFMAQCCLKQA